MTNLARIPVSNAYWLMARDAAGNTAAIDTEADLKAWGAVSRPGETCSLIRGGFNVAEIPFAHVRDVGDIIAAVGEIPSPEPEHSGAQLREVYTRGDCDVFARALQKIIGGDLYAVTDPFDEKGRPARRHYLVHAGVYDGACVYDIEGKNDADQWSQIWRENGNCVHEGETAPITYRRLQSLQMCKHSPEEIERATNAAWLIATLTGAIDPTKVEHLRARRPLYSALPIAA